MLHKDFTIVPALWPKGQTGAASGDIISMKNWKHCDIVIQVGASPGGTVAVTLDKSAAVSAASTTLAFTRYLRTGFRVDHGGASNAAGFTAGETLTGGTSGGTGVVVKDYGSFVLMHTSNGTAFSSGETITGGTSGYTATSTSASKNEDMLLDATASSNTFTIPAVANKTYVIPIDASDLGDGYDCLELEMAAPSAGTVTYGASYVLSGPRYGDEPAETAIYD